MSVSRGMQGAQGLLGLQELLSAETHRCVVPNLEGGPLQWALTGRRKEFITMILENRKRLFLHLLWFQMPKSALILQLVGPGKAISETPTQVLQGVKALVQEASFSPSSLQIIPWPPSYPPWPRTNRFLLPG